MKIIIELACSPRELLILPLIRLACLPPCSLASSAIMCDREMLQQKHGAFVEELIAKFMQRKLESISSKPGSLQAGALPISRIKRIMKQDSCDPSPRMVSADTTPLMEYGAQVFTADQKLAVNFKVRDAPPPRARE